MMRAGAIGNDKPSLGAVAPGGDPSRRWANAMLAAIMALAFGGVGGQLVSLGLRGRNLQTLAVTEAPATNFARPDIIDRNGRLLATDIEVPSLFADPALVLDRDEVVEKLATVLTDLNQADVRQALSDRSRRFIWVRRGLSPAVAQKVHDLGLPGLSFRNELRRAYPGGDLAGHVLGSVNVDNKGIAGIERYIDDSVGVEAVLKHFQGEVVGFDMMVAAAAAGSIDALYLTAGYPPSRGAWISPEQMQSLKRVGLLAVQDLMPGDFLGMAKYLLPASSFAEKDGTYVNHANLAQGLHWAVRPLGMARTDGQVFLDLMERRGLLHVETLRQEMAAEIGFFAPLAVGDLGEYGVRLGEVQ